MRDHTLTATDANCAIAYMPMGDSSSTPFKEGGGC